MADLDTKAADQFQPVHRSGHGAITFEGREYTRLAWIERTARNGGTLAAGEGAVLCAEIDRLRGEVDRLRGLLECLEESVFDQKRTQRIPDQTCPDIDSVIKTVKQCERLASYSQRSDNAEELRDALRSIEWDLSEIPAEMETLREANESLRDLGRTWAEIAAEPLKAL
jgi:hypothetical protein